jgi:hypothetical protein
MYSMRIDFAEPETCSGRIRSAAPLFCAPSPSTIRGRLNKALSSSAMCDKQSPHCLPCFHVPLLNLVPLMVLKKPVYDIGGDLIVKHGKRVSITKALAMDLVRRCTSIPIRRVRMCFRHWVISTSSRPINTVVLGITSTVCGVVSRSQTTISETDDNRSTSCGG